MSNSPLAKVTDDQLFAIRKTLERMFLEILHVHATTEVCKTACDVFKSDLDANMHMVLRVHVSDPIWRQLETLADIITQLGGGDMHALKEVTDAT